MTAAELKAEIKTIQKLSDNKAISAICDVLLDLVKAIQDKEQMGFRSDKK